MEIIDTNIRTETIVKYYVNGHVFTDERAAKQYVKKLEYYNKEYLSSKDPADALSRFLDKEISKSVHAVYRDELKRFQEIVSLRKGYSRYTTIDNAVKGIVSPDIEAIYTVYRTLSSEYSHLYH